MIITSINNTNHPMKRSTTLALFITIASLAHAQPVLTYAANAPVAGGSYTMHYGPYISPGPAGAAQTWDFSTLTTDSVDLIQLVQPASLPNGGSFTGATVAETGAVADMYYRAAPDGLYLVGSDADLQIVNTDQARYLPFPCTYQSTWTDDFASTFDSDGFTVFRSGEVTGNVDGYGSLTLPSGETFDVLRVHWHEVTVDSTAFFTLHTVYDSHVFHAADQPYPLLHLVTATSTFMGQSNTVTFSRWVDGISTGAEAPAAGNSGMQAFPVPASDVLHFTLPVSFSGTPVISITAADGRKVRTLPLPHMNGSRGTLDVSGMIPGVYHLTAIDELGQRATRGFVVQ